jgi:hypothetical protein
MVVKAEGNLTGATAREREEAGGEKAEIPCAFLPLSRK